MSGLLSQGPIFLFSLIFMLGLVVVIHELGHYLAGRLFNAAAESFSVGFGRPIFERTDKRGTRWRINWIPLGGFVKFAGEAQTAGDIGRVEPGLTGQPFMSLGVGARSIIAVAGPLANFLLAIVIFAAIAMTFGKPVQRIFVGEVLEGPAQIAGLQEGDVILSIDGRAITDSATLRGITALATGEVLDFEIERGGARLVKQVTPERMALSNGFGQTVEIGGIGVALGIETYDRISYGPIGGLLEGTRVTGEVLSSTTRMLTRMVSGKEPISHLSGPVGIGDVARRAVNTTLGAENVGLGQRITAMIWTLVQLCGLISVGIGLFNLLPLPVLDGGHLVFNAYEALTGEVLPQRVQEISLHAGLILLLGMAALVTWGDIVETGILASGGT